MNDKLYCNRPLTEKEAVAEAREIFGDINEEIYARVSKVDLIGHGPLYQESQRGRVSNQPYHSLRSEIDKDSD